MERSLILIKPDGVRRRLIGKIITRFEEREMNIVAARMLKMTSELADEHYKEHLNKDFYKPLKKFILSGPIIAMVIESEDVVHIARRMVGATNSGEAEPGSIRGDYSLCNRENIVHASDCVESAKREIRLFFPELSE